LFPALAVAEELAALVEDPFEAALEAPVATAVGLLVEVPAEVKVEVTSVVKRAVLVTTEDPEASVEALEDFEVEEPMVETLVEQETAAGRLVTPAVLHRSCANLTEVA